MVTWTHILIDGFNSILESLSGAAGDATKKSGIKEAARKAGINIPDINIPNLKSQASVPAFNSQPNTQTQENINNISLQQEPPNSRNFDKFKDPRVLKATTNVYAEYRMNQYVKQGWIEECLKQREERLASQD